MIEGAIWGWEIASGRARYGGGRLCLGCCDRGTRWLDCVGRDLGWKIESGGSRLCEM